MACTTLTAPGQACIKVPLLRGDNWERKMALRINGQPEDLSEYTIRMEIKVAGMPNWPPVMVMTEADMAINGNEFTISFQPTSPIYQEYYALLYGDIAFTKAGVTNHWLRLELMIRNSETDTWTL